MLFDSQTVMITGAAGNLGQAVATHFGQAGANLVLLDRQADALTSHFAAGPRVLPVVVDLLDKAQVQSAVARSVQRFGRIDVLCHLTGGFRMGEAVHETTDATWDFLFDINARTLLNLAREAVPQMIAQGSGKIICVGAFAAQKGAAHMGAYGASKSSVMRLSEAMSAELKGKHINVNCVLPTIIDTPENRRAMPDADPSQWVASEALAEVIAFLASNAARAIHGAMLPVTGLS